MDGQFLPDPGRHAVADGNPVEATERRVNAAGFTIHSAIHMAREDAQAVMHLHTPAGQAVSGMKEGLLPHTQTGMLVAGRRKLLPAG